MKFTAKLRQYGNSHMITVPADFVTHGLLKKGTVYEIDLKEVVFDGEK